MKTKPFIPLVALAIAILPLVAQNTLAANILSMDLPQSDSAKQNNDADLLAWTAGTSQTVNSLDPSNFGGVWGLKTSAFNSWGTNASFSIYDVTSGNYLVQNYSLAGIKGDSAIYGDSLLNLPTADSDTL